MLGNNEENRALKSFFMQAPAIMAILKGPDHVFELANGPYLETIGHRDPIGKTVLEALPEIEGQGFIELLDNVYKTGETFTGKEIPATIWKSGKPDEPTEIFIDLSYQALRDAKGEITGVLVFAYDVTELVLSRREVEASEQRYFNILRQSLLAIAIFKGEDMVISFANEPMLKIWGKTSDIFGKPLLEVLPEIKDQAFPDLLRNVYETGNPYTGYEVKAVHVVEGVAVEGYFNFVYQPFREIDDSISGITVLANDVTDEVEVKNRVAESENKLRFMAESMPQKIFTAEPNGDVDYFNPQWTEFTGLSFEEIRDWGWLQFIHPDDVDENVRRWQESIDTGKPFKLEHRFRAKTGEYRWHLSRANAMRDEEGNIVKWFGSNTDIHELKKVQEQLSQANEDLEVKVKFRNIELERENKELKERVKELEGR